MVRPDGRKWLAHQYRKRHRLYLRRRHRAFLPEKIRLRPHLQISPGGGRGLLLRQEPRARHNIFSAQLLWDLRQLRRDFSGERGDAVPTQNREERRGGKSQLQEETDPLPQDSNRDRVAPEAEEE